VFGCEDDDLLIGREELQSGGVVVSRRKRQAKVSHIAQHQIVHNLQEKERERERKTKRKTRG
jgi:hypothetical protein